MLEKNKPPGGLNRGFKVPESGDNYRFTLDKLACLLDPQILRQGLNCKKISEMIILFDSRKDDKEI